MDDDYGKIKGKDDLTEKHIRTDYLTKFRATKAYLSIFIVRQIACLL